MISIFDVSSSRRIGCFAWTVWKFSTYFDGDVALERRRERGVLELVLGVDDGGIEGVDLGSLGLTVFLAGALLSDAKVLFGLLDPSRRLIAAGQRDVVFRLRDGPIDHELRVAFELGQGLLRGGLGLGQRGLELLDFLGPGAALHRQEFRLAALQVSLGQVQRRLEIRRVDRGQQVALLDVVSDLGGQGDQGAGDAEGKLNLLDRLRAAGIASPLEFAEIGDLDRPNRPDRLRLGRTTSRSRPAGKRPGRTRTPPAAVPSSQNLPFFSERPGGP